MSIISCFRFILCDRHAVYEDSLDEYDEQAVMEAKDHETQHRQALLQQVHFNR